MPEHPYENMWNGLDSPKMTAAVGAHDLDTVHKHRSILLPDDCTGDSIVERRPAATGLAGRQRRPPKSRLLHPPSTLKIRARHKDRGKI